MDKAPGLPSDVSITVSDPWEFFDENDGILTFPVDIVGRTGRGDWVLRLKSSAHHEGRIWSFAIPLTRLANQRSFFEPNEGNQPANILFITDEQAADAEWLARFDDQAAPNTPWVIGSLTAAQPPA